MHPTGQENWNRCCGIRGERTLRSLPKRFPLLTRGYARCHWATPSCPGPGGLKSPVGKICKIATPCPAGSHIQINYSGVAWGQYVQAGMNGSERPEEPCRRVTKPWQTQPITFFSWLTKALTHGEAQTTKLHLKSGDGAGGVVPRPVGNQRTPTPAGLGQGSGRCKFR